MNAPVPRASYRILWIAVAVLIVNFAITQQNLSLLASSQQRIATSHATLSALGGLMNAVQGFDAAQQLFLRTEDDSVLRPYRQGLEPVEAATAALHALAFTDPQQRTRVATIEAHVAELADLWRVTIDNRGDQALADVRKLLLSERPRTLIDAVRTAIVAIEADEYRLLAERDRAAAVTSRQAMLSELLATVIGLALAWAVMWRTRREVATRGHLAAIVQSTEDAVASFDLDGRVLSWNAGATRLLGYTAREMIGQDARRLLPPGHEADERLVMQAMLAGQAIPSRVTRRLHRDGHLVDVLVTASPLLDPAGRPLGMSVIGQDLSTILATERELADSRTRLQLILDTVPVFIVDCDRQGRYRLVNRAYAERFGHPPEWFVGRTVREVLGERAWSVLAPYAARTLAGEPQDVELEMPYDGVGTRLMHAHCAPRRDEHGGFDGFVAIIDDVTERHASRRGAAQLAAIVESSDDAVISQDLDGRITSWNPAAERLYGYRADEVIGQPVAMLMPEDASPDEQAFILSRLRRGERVGTFETVRRARDGRRLDLAVTISPIRDDRGQVIGGSKIARDIGERKRMQAAQQQRQQRLEIATTAAALGVFEWDIVTGRAYWENDRMYEIYGRSPADGPISPEEFARDVLHPGHYAEMEAALKAGIRSGTMFQYAFRIRRQRDGAERWIEFVGRARVDAQGRPLRLAGVLADITERRQLEVTLREADRRKDEFLAMLAHELRNPLAPLRNIAELMRRRAGADPVMKTVQPMIERQVGHLAHLIDDLLDVSRINQGKISLARQPLLLNELVRDALAAARPATDARAHHVEFVPSPLPAWVNADPVRLTQVIVNLVNNAAKFTDPGGHIRVRVQTGDGDVAVLVADDGQGIDAEFLPHVFDLFSQGQRAADRSQGGLGIGLSLARSVTGLHGGTLTAASAGPGQGSEFVVRLPRIAAPPVEADGPVAPDATASARRVLVVDDNVDAARSLGELLRLAGHDAHVVHDGPAALALARELAPQCVVLDIGLPEMDGYEVARRLRASPPTQDATLIVVSGYGREQDRQRSREAGIDHHLVKPVNPAVLETLIR